MAFPLSTGECLQSKPSSRLSEAGHFLLCGDGLTEGMMSLITEQRNRVLKVWNAVEEQDKQPQQFIQLYRTHWGNTLYCQPAVQDTLGQHPLLPHSCTGHTGATPSTAAQREMILLMIAVVQRVKMTKRYTPSQQDISAQHNRQQHNAAVSASTTIATGATASAAGEKTLRHLYHHQTCALPVNSYP